MNNRIIKANNNRFLGDILGERDYNEIFLSKKNIFLNKGICGNGGTSGMIEYAVKNFKGLIVLCPNTSIVSSKFDAYNTDEYKGKVFCLWGDRKASEVDKDALVIICTYDKLRGLKSHIDTFAMTTNNEWWCGRTIVVDEYHILPTESSFREIMYDVVNLCITTENSCLLMSATPHTEFINTFKELSEYYNPKKICEIWTIEYEKVDKKLILIDTTKAKQPWRTLTAWLKREAKKIDNGHTLVFLNSPDRISEIITKIGNKDVCECICSANSREIVGEYFSEEYNSDKKIHFITSKGFTGWDCDDNVDNIIIISDAKQSTMCYSERDIKQMIGRDRPEKCKRILFFYFGGQQLFKAKIKAELNRWSNVILVDGVDWKERGVWENYLTYIVGEKDRLRVVESYSSIDSVQKIITESGYRALKTDIKKIKMSKEEMKIGRGGAYLSYTDLKKWINEGKAVNNKMNRNASMLLLYHKVNGHTNVSRRDLVDWYNVYKQTRGIDDNKIKKCDDNIDVYDSRQRLFGLTEFKVYTGAQLQMMCEKIGGDKIDIRHITRIMVERFNAYPMDVRLIWSKTKSMKGQSIQRLRHNGYIIIMNKLIMNFIMNELNNTNENKWMLTPGGTKNMSTVIYKRMTKTHVPNCVNSFISPIINCDTPDYDLGMHCNLNLCNCSFLSNELLKNRLLSSFVSIKTETKKLLVDNKTEKQEYAKTISLYDLFSNTYPLNKVKDNEEDLYFFTIINDLMKSGCKDPYHYIKDMDVNGNPRKESTKNKYRELKLFRQNKFSELYSDSKDEYHQVQEAMPYIDCLSCDIDDELPYSEFEKQNSVFFHFAYPSFSNVKEDWSNYRIVFPLAHRVYIKDPKMRSKGVQILRKIICDYVDPDQVLPSFISFESVEQSRVSNGKMLDIPQDFIDTLMDYIELLQDIIDEWNKKKTTASVPSTTPSTTSASATDKCWSLERSKQEFIDTLSKPTGRHRILLKIKSRLSDKYWSEFETFLYGYKWEYVTKFRNHRPNYYYWK